MLVTQKFAKKISTRVINDLAQLTPPFGPVGYVVYKRTYARKMEKHGRLEEWPDTIERCINGLLEIGARLKHDEVEQLAYYMYMLKGLPAGRPLWQLGTDTVRRLGGDSLQNCWHVAVNDPIEPFCFTFNQLMLGGGVGFNITPEFVYELPVVKFRPTVSRVDDFDCDYVVTDNREGWVRLLRKVLQSFFYTGADLRYDTRCIRPKGRPISGFGGIASGPEELVRGIKLIAAILTKAYGRKLRPTECMDIMNIIGMIVVAGNVRRSAEIAIGSYTDEEYIWAKDWSRHPVPEWRQMSNNTIDVPDVLLLSDNFWRGYEGQGEPYGLYNPELCKTYGRLADGPMYRPDMKIIGPNPCAEIILESYEACNLTETFLPNISGVTEFGQVAALLHKCAKAIGSLPFWHPKTNEVVTRNNRIGGSVTGFLQATHLHDPDIFDAVYTHLEDTDRELSKDMRREPSIKLTCVKPSGTLSLLAGVTAGVHAAFAPYYIRRIAFASNDTLVAMARRHGYSMAPKLNIDGTRDLNTMVIDFPCKTPSGTQCANGYSAIRQLKNQRFLQTYWADNAVSMSCYYRPEELPEIRSYLKENYTDTIKTASFFQHRDHGFQQAPFEEITEAQYIELASCCQPITRVDDTTAFELLDGVECSTGACPTR